MGWSDCGDDSQGRPIGYGVEATCDHPECDAKIDRGLSYACGGEHGDLEYSCEKYFCSEHLTYPDKEFEDGDGPRDRVCAACAKLIEQLDEDEEE